TDRHFTVQVLAVAHENFVLANRHLHIQVSGRPAIDTRFALPCQTDPVAGIHAGRHLHRQGLLLFHIAYAMTGLTGSADDLARAPTTGTGLLHGEKTLLHADLP